ncbi:Ctr copper transporter family-domain-containing protein [Gloeopeniophorella convolvens]|nr:Ctr copper transporter family-domain-containing protein [Gloeopeniophorella convolvens]
MRTAERHERVECERSSLKLAPLVRDTRDYLSLSTSLPGLVLALAQYHCPLRRIASLCLVTLLALRLLNTGSPNSEACDRRAPCERVSFARPCVFVHVLSRRFPRCGFTGAADPEPSSPSHSLRSAMGSLNTSTSEVAMMVPYLHFAGGDHLYFKSWQPSSHGAIAGASLTLVVLAMLERLFFAMRGVMEAHWRQTAFGLHDNRAMDDDELPTKMQADVKVTQGYDTPSTENSKAPRRRRVLPPFILSHDATRGVMYAFQALLAYILMLAVMTFQAAYIMSIIFGLGLGEVLFGRFAGARLLY